jgi:hypothetical protein
MAAKHYDADSPSPDINHVGAESESPNEGKQKAWSDRSLRDE